MEARLLPVFRLGNKSASYWVAMDVTQLLDAFIVGEHVEVVVSLLPEAGSSLLY
jgi:hypothetical protein